MRSLKLIWCMVLVLVILSISSLYAMAEEDRKPYSEEGAKIELFVSINKNTTAGMSVAYFDMNDILYSNHFGYMDIENQIPVTEETVMDWGSVSKLLIWVSVMQLVEQDKIDLEEDIRNYLPDEFLCNLEYDKAITMTNLMNHNAGFEENIVGMSVTEPEDVLSLEEYLSKIQPTQVFEPGTVCAYSNWGTSLAAYIVERVSGMHYYEYVRKYIFEPLGMKDTALSADLKDNEDVRQRRLELKTYTTDVLEITPNISYSSMYPAGMCTSTLGDMVRFAKALLDENTILFKEKETYNELFTATMYYNGTSKIRNCHGFWALEGYGTELIGHNGVTSGCSSNLVLDLKNKRGMVIQTNQRNEQVYNFGMLYRIFGGNGRSLENYSGLIMSARSVFTGPLKLYSLFNIASVENGNSPILLVKRTNEGGIDRIACAYGDYFVIDTGDIATDIAVLALYGISVLYAIINILIYIIRRIVALKKHKKIEKPMAGWCKLSCVLPLVPAIVGVLVIPTFLELQQWPYLVYKILFFIIFMDILAMMVLVLYGIFKMIKCEMKKLRKAYVISMNICMIMAVVSAIYWEWGMFWKV